MAQSKYFNTIKKYYDKKIYKKAHIKAFVRTGNLTEEEYKLITGEDYHA